MLFAGVGLPLTLRTSRGVGRNQIILEKAGLTLDEDEVVAPALNRRRAISVYDPEVIDCPATPKR